MNCTTKHSLWSWQKLQASLVLLVFFVVQWQASLQLAWAQVTTETRFEPLVAVLVEENLLNDAQLKSRIYRYAEDAQKTLNAQALVVPIAKTTSVKDIYEGLSEWYWSGYQYDSSTRLSGVVLVGDLPLPVVDKNGRLWPTVFPYVDFESPAYVWDDSVERFVSRRTQNMQAEIWHGLIRGDSETESVRREQLRQYFDENHRVHTGEITFGKKVFHADLQSQKSVVPAALLDRYDSWVKYAEDLQYLRFTKHLVKALRESDDFFGEDLNPFAGLSEADQLQLINEIAGSNADITVSEVAASIESDGTEELPDIYSKYLIDQLAPRYQDIFKNWISQVNGTIANAGRWDPTEIDTLPSLVSSRDEAVVLYLRALNDQLEERLVDLITDANVAHRPWVEENTEVDYYEMAGPIRQDFTVTRPNYWNGVVRDANFSVEDCTLSRGNRRSFSEPLAQQVEANRTFDPSTAESCVTNAATDEDKEDDLYEGCCAANLSYANGSFSYTRCDTGSSWTGDEGLDSVVHQGSELPVYSLAGTSETQQNLYGAAGCLPIIETTNVDESDSHRFSSLMLHQEPTASTIQAQLTAQTSRALPVDSPRGVSFLDHGLSPQRLNFANLFTLRDQSFSAPAQAKTALETLLTNKITAINDLINEANTVSDNAYNAFQASCGGTYTEGQYDTFTVRADCDGQVRFFETAQTLDAGDYLAAIANIDETQFYDAIAWLDRSVDEKNQMMLELTLSDNTDWASTLLDLDYNGYELSQVLADGTADRINLGFTPPNETTDDEFIKAQREALLGELSEEKRAAITYQGADFVDTFLAGEALASCDDIENSVLSWAEKLECHFKNSPVGGTVELFIPDLGKKEKLGRNTLSDGTNKLDDKILRITPDKILVHNKGVDPVPVTVIVTDKENRIQKDLTAESVRLRFSSPSVAQFFEIFPTAEQSLTAGKAQFWLVPKTQEYGGKFALIAEAEQGETVIRSDKVPLVIPRYRLQLTTAQPIVNVKNPNGIPLSVKVLDQNNKLKADWIGRSLRLEVSGGTIEGGNQIELSDLSTSLIFYPGTQAGTAEITITDPAGEIAPDTVLIELKPDVPAAISLRSAERYAIAGSAPLAVTAEVTDAYGNVIEDLLHEYTWAVSNGTIIDQAERDEDPRQVGLQEVVTTGSSQVLLRPDTGKLRLEVKSDKLKNAGRSLEWTIIKDPEIIAELENPSVVAGVTELGLSLTATDTNKARLNGDFAGQILISHQDLRQNFKLNNGGTEIVFDPGTVAGKFTGQVTIPGFKTQEFEYEVLPAPAKKITLEPVQNRSNYDVNEPLSVRLSIQDQYGNQVKTGGTVLIKASDVTNDLIAPLGNVTVENGSSEITLTPTKSTGTLNLIAHKDELLPGTLSLELINSLTVADLSNLTPRSLLSLWLGFDGGNILEKNWANAFLHSGQAQAVGSLMAPPEPGAMKVQVSPTGIKLKTAQVKIVDSAEPLFYFTEGSELLTSAWLNFGRKVSLWLDAERSESGVYLNSVPRFENRLTQTERGIELDGQPLFQVADRGGIMRLNSGISFETEDSLTDWVVYYQGDKVGILHFYAPGSQITITPEWDKQTAGLQLQEPLDSDLEWMAGVMGNHHLSSSAWQLVDRNQIENRTRRLGDTAVSVEDAGNLGVGWTERWKPGTLLAAGNSVGESTRIGASDIFVLYGDPTLSVNTQNQVSARGVSRDIGRAVWTAPSGEISQLVSGNFLDPAVPGILAESNDRFRLLLPQEDGSVFDWGEILTTDKNIEQVAVLNNDLDREVSVQATDDLVILDIDGDLKVHDLSGGNWASTDINLPKARWIGTGRFNDDGRSDLAFVDEDLNIGVVMRNGTSFSVPYYLGSLAPNFTDITESDDDEVVRYLGATWWHYEGIEKEATLQDKLQSINLSAQARTALDLDNLAETLTADYKQAGTGLGNKKYFAGVAQDPSVASTFTLRTNANQIKAGDVLSAQLTLRSDTTRSAVEVMLPSDTQLDFDRSTLSCVGCPTTPKFYRQSGFGSAWVYLDTIPARQTITLRWDYEVETLPLRETISIGDRDGDGLDDLIISRGNQLLQYLSRDQGYQDEALVIPAIDTPELPVELVGVPTVIDIDGTDPNSYDRLSEVLTPLLDDPQTLANEFIGQLSADNDQDGIPDNFDNYPGTDNAFADDSESGGVLGDVARMVQDFSNKKQDLLCGYGDCFNFPLSIAFFAPGFRSLYIPPITIPMGFVPGSPVLSWPTTKPTPSGPVPSIFPADLWGRFSEPAPFLSTGRLYLMPTTTGHLGIALCTGLYPVHMVPPAWLPNCLVVTPKIDFLGVCEGDAETGDDDSFLAAAVTTVLARSGSAIQVDPQGNLGLSPGEFTAQLDFSSGNFIDEGGSPNINIPGIDLVADWLQAQMREFSNFGSALPSLQMNFPDRTSETRPPNTSAGTNALEDAAAQLSQYPFVTIERKAVTLPYPNISGPDLDAFMEQFEDWRANIELSAIFDLSLPDLSSLIAELREFQASLEALLAGIDIDLAISIQADIKNYLTELRQALSRLQSDYERFCLNALNPNREQCEIAASLIIDYTNLQASLEEWQNAFSSLDLAGLQRSIDAFGTEINELVSSLENLRDLRVNAEDLIASAETNLETLESYKEIPEKLSEIPEKVREMLAIAADGIAQMEEFWQTYSQDLGARLEEWEQAFDMISITFGIFDDVVLRILVNFNNNCRTCVVDRGTLLSWLLTILVGAIDLPVFKLPQFPDIILDFTGLDLGLTFVIPDRINFEPVDVQLFSLPDLSGLLDINVSESLEAMLNLELPAVSDLSTSLDGISQQLVLAETLSLNLPEVPDLPSFDADGNFNFDGRINLPGIPAPNLPSLEFPVPDLPTISAPNISLPELPQLPQISVPDIDIPIPSLSLPNLPTIPAPPELSLSFIDSIAALVEIPFAFLDLFCILRLGVAPVPEWYVKPYVEQLTNRVELSFGLDFGFLSLKDFNLGRDSIDVAIGFSLLQVFDPVSQIVESISEASESLITNFSQDRYRGEETENIPLPLGEDLQGALPGQWTELKSWAEKTRRIHAQNQGKTVGLDEFWDYLQERMLRAEPQSVAQQQLQYRLLALDKPEAGISELPNLVAQNFTKTETKLARIEDRLASDLTVLEKVAQMPISNWAGNSALQSHQRFLATVETDYEFYERDTFDAMFTGNAAATQETDGSVSSIVPNLSELPLADIGIPEAPTLPASTLGPKPGLYYQSIDQGTIERLTEYVPSQTVKLMMTDFDQDEQDEIWWTENGVLYRKEIFSDNKAEDFTRTPITVATNDFLDRFAPGVFQETYHFSETQALEFDDIDTSLDYWEWVVSDHYDILNDIQKRPENRLARSWQRAAYINISDLAETGIKIEYIAGNPIFTRNGVETAVTASTVVKDDFIVRLGSGDQVELLLPDGSGVSLLSGETYILTGIPTEASRIRLERSLSESGFGLLVGIQDNKRSHLIGPLHNSIATP